MFEKEIRQLRCSDPILAKIIRRIGPCKWVRDGRNPFEILVKAIIYQQVTGKAAATIYDRFKGLSDNNHCPSAGEILRISYAQFRKAGISRQKRTYIRDLAAKVDSGEVCLHRLDRLNDEEVIATLKRVKGIGQWTAEMFLMFCLGRMDILAVTDYGLRQAIQRAYRTRNLPIQEKMRRIAEPWRPYRSIASWYLWRSIGGDPG